jgi:hypothetical protein
MLDRPLGRVEIPLLQPRTGEEVRGFDRRRRRWRALERRLERRDRRVEGNWVCLRWRMASLPSTISAPMPMRS